MQTTKTFNDTVSLDFIGENSNGTCISSEKGEIVSDTKSNRVSIHWSDKQGFLEMVYSDENLIHLILCYSIDSNTTDICAHNQSEQLVIQKTEEYQNDSIVWIKSHCSSLNPDDFIVTDNPKKCVPVVSQPEIIEVNTIEPLKNDNITIFQTTYIIIGEQENVTVTPMPESEFTTRTNRTNRLEILEEYYNKTTGNSTGEEHVEETTVTNIKEIFVLSANASVIDELNRTNITIIEQIESVGNETIDEKYPLVILNQTVIDEAVKEILSENLETTEHIPTKSLEIHNSTELNLNLTTPIHSVTTIIPTLHTEKEFLNETTKTSLVENSTILMSTKSEVHTTPMMEIITELMTTTEATTSTPAIPADCPILKDCQFDYCAFARKFDNRGCPTCNCVQSNKSNITCPTLACQACLYGHHTDPNGCSVCQCQSRPYPLLGERCPSLSCEPCYFGTVKDEYNCDTCVCIRPNNQECPVLDCTFGPCKYGSIKDEDDCPTCDCLLPTNNTTEVNCSTSIACPSCHLGYVKDADGCQTCQCKLRGNVPCASISSQCYCDYGSYLNSDGCETCSCLPDPKNASRQACWELSNQANFHNITGPSCSLDGSFYARQCDKTQSKCWCVTPTGLHITGFESGLEENVNCACAVELYQVSSLRMIGHHLLCLLNGNYAPIQCDGRYCSCVDENGKAIGPSVSIQNRDQLRCVGVYQQLHPERFISHRSSIIETDHSRLPYGISSSLCLKHLEQVRNANITDDHILIPECDINGLYSSVQCDQSERFCWCVDKKTGVEVDGTRRLNARPNCIIL
ncbi:unnamed protein product [Adineta steineri]|uniref:Uncharacterized protein n=2 Tax=Adineta steineri TaxID=433720 RepID=A0A813QCM2_9BILA|nr:unnamed protein product [Adineta steineri]